MGQLAFLRTFLLVAFPIDANENRRHIHVFFRGGHGRHMQSLAKIWIESGGEMNVEIAYSSLSEKENRELIDAIEKNWEFINNQITKTFNGQKTTLKNLED